jgi:predicted nucleic acid-binding protein
MPLILIDTNILIYAHDYQDRARRDRAVRIIRQLQLSGIGRLSVQCLAEFASVATRRLRPRLTWAEALVQVERLAQAFQVFDLTPQIVGEAARGARDHQLAYYDAQLWGSARLNQVPVIFSEDFASGTALEGVRFVNPFASAFALEDWALS